MTIWAFELPTAISAPSSYFCIWNELSLEYSAELKDLWQIHLMNSSNLISIKFVLFWSFDSYSFSQYGAVKVWAGKSVISTFFFFWLIWAWLSWWQWIVFSRTGIFNQLTDSFLLVFQFSFLLSLWLSKILWQAICILLAYCHSIGKGWLLVKIRSSPRAT